MSGYEVLFVVAVTVAIGFVLGLLFSGETRGERVAARMAQAASEQHANDAILARNALDRLTSYEFLTSTHANQVLIISQMHVYRNFPSNIPYGMHDLNELLGLLGQKGGDTIETLRLG